MRLTPSWLRSDTSAEEADSGVYDVSGVTVYQCSGNGFPNSDTQVESRVDAYLPRSDERLLAVLESMETPVTVDEIADQLIEPARPSIDTWAAVHQHLQCETLPALDERGDIDFNQTDGIVESAAADTSRRTLHSFTFLGLVAITLLVPLIAFVSLSTLTAVLVSLVTMLFTLWFVP
ncbi:hypothetical protein OB919_10910 [Halobacteria archaeon AArc-curdl1]|uniref:Uncharacterized protein n=1 Tax=Natronosalvus hydrolyticus TaxID=2979988 RepID=A0AAP2Z875_9EURY|nr:hypothetical protein [Halobacteria archaeon AArc-curdl1]